MVGQSGSGKTTLLSLLAGLDIPTSGSIQLFQHTLESLGEDERAALRNQYIGFVFQAFHLLLGFTALENVMLPLEINNNLKAEQYATQLLERVGMQHRLNHYPTTLSGGEQQRVAIARALITGPSLILADEPTGNLDSRTSLEILSIFQTLNRDRGITVIYVTHEAEIAEHAGLIIQMRDGLIVDDIRVGSPRWALEEMERLASPASALAEVAEAAESK